MGWTRRVALGVCTLVLATGFASRDAFAGFEPGFTTQDLARPDGQPWAEAVGLQFTPSGRLFVWERGGSVWIIDAASPSTARFLDLRNEVAGYRDHGLLGFALHPSFETNGYVYALYVVERHHLVNCDSPRIGAPVCGPGYTPGTHQPFNATIGRIVRYKAVLPAGDTDYKRATAVDPASRRTLYGDSYWFSDPNRLDPTKPRNSGCPILHESHGVGSIVFGQDGTLLASCGDGASYNTTDLGPDADTYYQQGLNEGIILPKENVGALRSQMVDSFSGKVIRIDADTGDAIPSNPFYDASKPRSARSRLWSLGLRNPYRFTLRPNTGSHNPAVGNPGVFMLGDVGWNTFEDLHVISAPAQNFGWPLYEGQTVLSSYFNANVQNLDAPNPNNTCGRPFFYFRELLVQDTLGTPSWPNPCNASLQITSADVFMHARPALDWRHGQDISRFAAFNGNDAVAQQLGTVAPDGTTVTGTPLRGNTSTGGFWYTGDDFPPQYKNTYFHGDYGEQWIRNYVFDDNNVLKDVRDFGIVIGGVVSMTTHPTQGGLYYIAWTAFVRKVSYTPTTNVPPVAVATVDKNFGGSPLTVQLSGAQSTDANGGALTYTWNFGDGSSNQTGINVSHTYTAAGVQNFTATLTVRDSGNLSSTATVLISVNNTPPTVQITSPVDGSLYSMAAPTNLPLTAQLSDTESGSGALACSWTLILHHNNHTHQDPPITTCSASTLITPVGCDGQTYFYELLFSATDPQGLKTTASSRIFPDCGGGSDTEPPTAPSSLTATGAGQTQINLAWTASTDNVAVSNYLIERCTGAGCSNFVQVASTSSTSFNNTSLSAGTTYVYRIRATDAASNLSGYSNTSSATTQSPNPDTTPPTTPASLGATVVNQTQINLSWTASTDNVAVTNYLIERCTGSACSNFAQIGTATGTTFNNTGLTASTSYSYRVRATDAASNFSGYSNTASGTTPATPATVIRVNVGGPQYTDTLGNVWSADANFNTGNALSWGSSVAIAGTSDPTLYRTERWDSPSAPALTYTFTVPNGTYDIRLLFAENSSVLFAVGQRVFDVQVNGALAIDNLDVFAQAGARTALIKTLTATVTNGSLAIAFIHGVEDPFVNAIEVIAQTGPPDTTPPTAPSGLGATAVSQTQINLAWTAATDNVAVTGYQIERCAGAGCSNFAQVGTTTGAVVTFNNTGLTAGTTYNYRVRATDGVNPSAYSNTATATTLAPDTTPPTAPSSLGGTATSTTQISLSWTAATDNVAVTGYRIERCTGATCSNFAQISAPTGTGTTFNNTGLAANTTYNYRVRAVDAAANLGPYSNTATHTTLAGADTTAPTAPSALATSVVSQTQINLAWTASTDNVAVTGYLIERCTGASCTNYAQIAAPTGTATTFSNTGLTASTTYRYRVRARDAANNQSAYSNVANGTTPAPPADTTPPTAPAGLGATVIGANQINLSWTASTDNVAVTGYLIERCTGAGCSNFAQIAAPTGTATTYSNTGLTGSTSYSYRVRARDAANNQSAYSNIASGTTSVAPATAIRVNAGGPAFTDSSGNSWSADTGFNTGTALTYPASTVIAGTNDPQIYRAERWDSTSAPEMTYTFTVPNGTYTVRLHFAENYSPLFAVGQRVFDVQIQGVLAFDNIDVFAQAGARTALIKTATANVTNGSLTITFVHQVEDPLINGIEVLSQPSTPDTTAPTAPGGLSSTAVSQSQINLAWTGSSDNVGVTNYLIERCTGDACADFTQIATTTGTTFNNTTLAAATSYSYRVRATDAAANLSGYSNTASATTQSPPPPDTIAPTAPAGLGTTVVNQSQINLSWTASTDNVAVTNYLIERCAGAGCSDFAQIATTASITFNNTGLSPLTSYSYRVRATDAATNLSAYSNVATASTPATPATVIRMNVGGPAYTDSASNVWSADNGSNTGNALSWGSSLAIAGTSDPTLYRTERWDSTSAPELTYTFTVPNGNYTVRLHFAENSSVLFAVGQRVFDVQVNGALAIDNLDVFAQAGAHAALVKTVTANVTNGSLAITFIHQVEDPFVNAIEVISQ